MAIRFWQGVFLVFVAAGAAGAPRPAVAAEIGPAIEDVWKNIWKDTRREPPVIVTPAPALPGATDAEKPRPRHDPGSPSAGLAALLASPKASAFIDYVAQQFGAPKGEAAGWIKLVRDLSDEGGGIDPNTLSPGQRRLLFLGQTQYGKNCGPFVTLASLQTIQPIIDTEPDVQRLCTMLSNAAVIGQRIAR